jgi:hypothetical protein
MSWPAPWHPRLPKPKSVRRPRGYLEKLIVAPRHVEIQVLADHERTCTWASANARSSAGTRSWWRSALGAVAPPACAKRGRRRGGRGRAVDSRGAGTCEFLLASDGASSSCEMKHPDSGRAPVTEAVYGRRLWSASSFGSPGACRMTIPAGPPVLRTGMGNRVPDYQRRSANGFCRPTGRVDYLRVPAGPRGSVGQRHRDW